MEKGKEQVVSNSALCTCIHVERLPSTQNVAGSNPA